MRTKHPQQQMDEVKAGAHVAYTRTLTRSDLSFELMMNALRLSKGVPATLSEERTGQTLVVCAAALERARTRDLQEADPGRLKPTLQGSRLLNDLLELFLPAGIVPEPDGKLQVQSHPVAPHETSKSVLNSMQKPT